MRGEILILAAMLSVPAGADQHRHTWGDETCMAESCIRGCCQQTCWASCTYPDCGARQPRNKSRGTCPPPPGEGSFGGGGATEPYGGPWSPRPGAAPAHEHRYSQECGGWSRHAGNCHKRTCRSVCSCGDVESSWTEWLPDGCGS